MHMHKDSKNVRDSDLGEATCTCTRFRKCVGYVIQFSVIFVLKQLHVYYKWSVVFL